MTLNYLWAIQMYVLMLSVIFVLLVIICVTISSGSTMYPLGPYTQSNNLNFQPNHNSEAILQLPYNLSGETILNVDLTRTNCYIDENSKVMGLYNLSVKKFSDGYQGIIRGSTWNGCCAKNILPSFSYPYYISLDNDGIVKDLFPVELDYSRVSNCKSNFHNIQANGIEDPRLFIFQSKKWVIGNCLGSLDQSDPCINAMCLFKVSDPENTFRIIIPPKGVDPLQRQKNWSPFEWNGKLLCEYSIVPHVILEIDSKTGMTEEIYRTGLSDTKITEETSLRGGTCPILISHNSQLFYLGMGHIRIGATSDYFHFFYTFEITPPFTINKISRYFKSVSYTHLTLPTNSLV